MKRILALVSAFVVVFALATIQAVPVALAHAEPEDCTPAIDSTVDTVPTQVVCTTGQAMDPALSTLSVFNAAGDQVDSGDSAVDLNDPDRKTISVSLDTSKITDGVYTVKYVTFSTDDNEEAEGEFHFTVALPGAAATPAATESPAMSETPAATETHEEGEAHEPGGTHSDDHSIATATVDGNEISLQITAPAKGATTVPAGDVLIEAKVEGVTLGENDTHLVFQVDEDTLVNAEGAATSHTAFLEPGSHDLKVTLTVGGVPGVLQAHVHVTVEEAAAAQVTETSAPQATETPAAEATATAAPEAPMTLPATGGPVNYGVFALLAVAGLFLLSTGAFVAARARRR